jgi:hypothetical protein
MRSRKAVLGVAGLLALGAGATAVAAPGGRGPLGGVFGPDVEERRAEQAKDLARELKLPEERVREAIDRVGERRRAERRAERAKALAQRLDVSQSAAERALEKGRAAAERELGRGRPERGGPGAFRPREAHGAFVRVVARELDKSAADVRRALQDIRRDRLNAELDEAVREGRLSREQADRIRRHAEDGPGHAKRFRFRDDGPRGPRNRNGGFLMPAPPAHEGLEPAETPASLPGGAP